MENQSGIGMVAEFAMQAHEQPPGTANARQTDADTSRLDNDGSLLNFIKHSYYSLLFS
jgi:hypothetical protein